MYYDSSLTKKDRIKLVIDMYKEGATRPELLAQQISILGQ